MSNRLLERLRHIGVPRLSCRMVVQAELAMLLLGSVALTVMPEETLAALSAASASAHGLALAYRPVVALLGLVVVALLVWTMYAMRQHSSQARSADFAADLAKREPLRPAA